VSYREPGKEPEPMQESRIEASTSMPPPPTKWAPTVNTQHTSQGYLRLQWEGKNKADLDELHREAQSSVAAGNVHDAEENYLQALAGYEAILSPTHNHTCAVAYELAEFYANIDRMNEADKVLDWLTEKHVEHLGVGHKQTRAHLIVVADMVFRWGRLDDSMTLVLRAAENYEESLKAPLSSEISSRARQKTYGKHDIVRDELRLPPLSGGTLAMYGDDDPVRMDYQMRVAITRAGTREHGSDSLLLRLQQQAERQPEKLAVPILEARNALIGLYSSLDEDNKYEQSLSEIESALLKIFDSKAKITELLLDRAVELVGQLVKAERFDQAETLLQRIQLETVKRFGEHDDVTISVLIRIGLLFQEEDRWKDARPRFEQALAASIASNGLRNMLTRRLEESLEKRAYTSSLPGSKDIRRQAEIPDSSQRTQAHDLNHVFGFTSPVQLMTALFAP
jgi:tetratricopeptide (TPR) repeat protein